MQEKEKMAIYACILFCRIAVLQKPKLTAMKDFEKIFERFGQMLEERKPYLDRRCSFVSICSELGVDPGDFGSFVFSRVGFTGEEVLEIYRRSETEQVFP